MTALAVVVAVPIALTVVFPLDALRAPPSPVPMARDASFAFVSMTPEEERAILASARSAWRMDRDRGRHMRIALLPDSIPEFKTREPMDVGLRPRPDRRIRADGPFDLRPPTLAAPPPVVLPARTEDEAAAMPFSREELLQLK